MNLKPGDKVQWTKTTSGRRSFSMTRHEGTVEMVALGGDYATVKTKGGRVKEMRVTDLSLVGQRTGIDVVVEALRSQ